MLAAVAPAAAIDQVREGFRRHHAGDWSLPAKVYLQSPPFGDFRANPAGGDGFALLKWITGLAIQDLAIATAAYAAWRAGIVPAQTIEL